MITGAIILIFISIVSFFMGLLPNMDVFPTAFNDAWDWMADLIASFLWVIPGGEDFLAIVNTLVLVLGGIFLWKIVNWVINKLRGSGN